MYRKIIFNGHEGRFDVPFFTLSDNESLNIGIALSTPKDCSIYFTAKHGEATKRVKMSENSIVELSPDWLKQGGAAPILCEIEIRDQSGIVVYKKYNVEPLNAKSSDIGMEYVASVQKLEEETETLKREVEKLKRIVSALPEAIAQAKKEAVIEAAGGDPMGA